VHDLARDIDALKRAGFRLIVIDTPPALTASIAEVVTYADLVVIPSRPSPHDLRAMGPTVDIVEHQHKPLVFVVNAATARARITGETAVALSQHGTVAPVTLHQRVDFAASMIDGRTVGEVNPESRSAMEVSALWGYLADRLMRLRGTSDAVLGHVRPTFVDEVLTPARRESISVDDGDDSETEVDPTVAPVPVPVPAPVVARRASDEIPPISSSPSGGWDGVDRRAKPSFRWSTRFASILWTTA
jgi:chromosome partitioning protein